MARPSGRPVRDEVLDAARVLIQRVGVDGFSYADIAKQLEIKAPSIHHHFATKEDLVSEVAKRYRLEFAERVASLDGASATERLLSYAHLFDTPASSGLLCLCGAIAAEWPNIGERPRHEVATFFAEQQEWLAEALAAGVESGEFSFDESADALAQVVLASLEGAMLMARADTSPRLAQQSMTTLLATIRS